MIYEFDISQLPEINKIYTVTRKTIWQVADPYNILLFILDGRCTICIDTEEYVVNKGDLFFIPANQTYTRKPINDEFCSLLYIHFITKTPVVSYETTGAKKQILKLKEEMNNQIMSSENMFAVNNRIYLYNHLKTGDKEVEIRNLLEKALEINLKNTIESSMMITLYLCQILAYCTQITLDSLMSKQMTVLENSIPPKLQKAIMYIRQNYSRKISLDDLCKLCNVSKQQMIRYFKTACGKTPTAYILDFKLNKAKEMFLNHPHLSIKEVCNELGFEDQHYFSRIFTKINKETPSQYKYRVNHFDESKHLSQ